MRVLTEDDRSDAALIDEHVALPSARPTDRAFVRLEMISSADGGTAIDGVSRGLGNRNDHAMFNALRDRADAILVGLATVVAEHYAPPARPELRLYVVTSVPDVSGNPELFESGRATLVLPEDADPAPPGVPELRAGTGRVDLGAVLAHLPGQTILLEGGPRLAGEMVALGLVDEFFHTVSPMLISGASARVTHGAPAETNLWNLTHGFCDESSYLFLRYARG
jgi:riboflavin biosynthesis pyrimidine reductase